MFDSTILANAKGLIFFVGLHQPSDAKRFPFACVSIRRLWTRRKPVQGCWLLIDSGAFTELAKNGRYQISVERYARRLYELHVYDTALIAGAVSQDFMCEDVVLEKTLGLAKGTITPAQRVAQIAEHQRLTIERYDALMAELRRLFRGRVPFPVLSVLQGYDPQDYVRHLAAYGDRIPRGAWVGVGSVCKRNGDPKAILAVLRAIKAARPDLKIHAFGLKKTALKHPEIRALLASADSMAWSHHARKNGRSANDWREAQAFAEQINQLAA